MLCKAAHTTSRHLACLTAAACILLLTSVTSYACPNHAGAQAHSHDRLTAAAATASVTEAAAAGPDWIQYEDYSSIESRIRTARLLLASSQAQTDGSASTSVPATVTTASSSSSTSSPQQQQQRVERPGPRCGARNVTALEHSSIAFKLSKARLSAARLAKAADKPGTMSIASVQQPRSLTVSVYFHVISGTTSDSTVSAPPDLLAQQLAVMNSAYGPWNIRFDLKGVTRVQSDSWALTEINSDQETAMKNRLRRGGSSDLNIYFIRPSSGTLGWSTFPWEMSKLGQAFDGVVVHVGTLPGGTMAPYNKGYTLVHEVGHWLGLLHVFENGCGSPGDSVDDTAPQASAAYGCPLDRHTCAGLSRDPVTNYMGYTDDTCMTGFTRGQADRVLDLWGVYRGVLDDNIVTESGSVSGAADQPQPQQQQQQQQKPPGTGLGMLLPVLFRRNFGQKDASAVSTGVGVATVNEDSASLYGSAIPQDPAAVFAQQQAAVAVATGQDAATPSSSQTATAMPQYYQQQQYVGGYSSSPTPQQQQGPMQGYYYTSPIPGSQSPSGYVPSFTTTYRPYTAAEAALPAIYGTSNPAAVATGQQAVHAAAWPLGGQQQSIGSTLQFNSYNGQDQVGYHSLSRSPPTASPSPVYMQDRPARVPNSSSSSSGTSSDQWQSTLLAAMGGQQAGGWMPHSSSDSSDLVGSSTSSAAGGGDVRESAAVGNSFEWVDVSQLTQLPGRKMGGSGMASKQTPLQQLLG